MAAPYRARIRSAHAVFHNSQDTKRVRKTPRRDRARMSRDGLGRNRKPECRIREMIGILARRISGLGAPDLVVASEMFRDVRRPPGREPFLQGDAECIQMPRTPCAEGASCRLQAEMSIDDLALFYKSALALLD